MTIVRTSIEVRGQVQGVGFRPYVFRLAGELGLGGAVRNDARGVHIDIEGPADLVETFAQRLPNELPPLARIDSIRVFEMPPLGRRDFAITTSEGAGEPKEVSEAWITPDVCVCDDCLAEIRDPQDRRHGYVFTNCTNCGPRYSIIHGVPYDRPNTTMASFAMCPCCRAEYENPADRRFHAQPIACPHCGPRVWLERGGLDVGRESRGALVRDRILARAAVAEAVAALRSGAIVAIKGIGGFHLACRAESDEAVGRLRLRKGRESKPFALMVADLAAARRIAIVSDADARLLASQAAPIVLLPKRPDAAISQAAAPGTHLFGLMLPYSPLHHALFDHGLGPLVMTSGNASEEPLCADNDDARRRLAPLADLVLMHDRDIHAPIDDSVVIGGADPPILVRRARGYVPAAIHVPEAADEPILALGGDGKAVFCVLRGQEAVLSEHLGELSSASAYRHYVESIERLCRLLRVQPRHVVHDLHPGYQSTNYAKALAASVSAGVPAGRAPAMHDPHSEPCRLLAVQHHHAHLAGCLAENTHVGPAVGVICDGTGYGTDGAIWGCEILVGDAGGFRRAGHLRYFGLPGGDAAAREPWRPAVSLLYETYGAAWRERVADLVLGREPRSGASHDGNGSVSDPLGIDVGALDTVERMLRRGFNCPPTSSLGRLFDAVAFLLGLCNRNGHEAQAAMALEAAAAGLPSRARLPLRDRSEVKGQEAVLEGCSRAIALPWAIDQDASDDVLRLDVRPMIRAIVDGRHDGRAAAELAAGFHLGIAAMLAEAAERAATAAGLDAVALSGGCFLNRTLLEAVRAELRSRGLHVLMHHLVPPGDGGLSLGQAVIAARHFAEQPRGDR